MKDAIAMKKWEQKLKSAEEKVARMEAQQPLVCGLIWNSISESSRLLLKAYNRIEVDSARRKSDIISLWTMITKTHTAGATSASTHALQAELEFSLGQKSGQSVLENMEESTQSIEALSKLGVIPDKKMLAFGFLKGLKDPMFHSQVERWTAENRIPTDFQEARKLTFDWYTAHKPQDTVFGRSGSNVFVAKGEKITCRWCEKKGHSAQECYGLLAHKTAKKAGTTLLVEEEDDVRIPYY
jgi:hypothetical protein